MSQFILNNNIQNDSFFIIELDLCQIRLMNNQDFIWLLLIPQINDIVHITDLSSDNQQTLIKEINQVSIILKKHFNPIRLNIGMLGNFVSQMHWHIIARFDDDKAWPNSAWGISAVPYQNNQETKIISLFYNELSKIYKIL